MQRDRQRPLFAEPLRLSCRAISAPIASESALSIRVSASSASKRVLETGSFVADLVESRSSGPGHADRRPRSAEVFAPEVCPAIRHPSTLQGIGLAAGAAAIGVVSPLVVPQDLRVQPSSPNTLGQLFSGHVAQSAGRRHCVFELDRCFGECVGVGAPSRAAKRA